MAGLLVSTFAYAATGNVTITGATTYVDGTPLPPSAVAGYDVRCSSFTPIGGTAGSCSFTPLQIRGGLTGIITLVVPTSGGRACFEAQTVLTNGVVSAWFGGSGAACKDYPATAPGTGTIVVAQVVGVDVVVAFTVNASNLLTRTTAGFVAVGDPCVGSRIGRYRAQDYYRVAPERVRWFRGVSPSPNVAAPCA